MLLLGEAVDDIDEAVDVFVEANWIKLKKYINIQFYIQFNSQLMTTLVTFTSQQIAARNPDPVYIPFVANLTFIVVLMLGNGPGMVLPQ